MAAHCQRATFSRPGADEDTYLRQSPGRPLLQNSAGRGFVKITKVQLPNLYLRNLDKSPPCAILEKGPPRRLPEIGVLIRPRAGKCCSLTMRGHRPAAKSSVAARWAEPAT